MQTLPAATAAAINAPRAYDAKQLDLIRRTVAKDTNAEEFDMFIEICRRQQLDPFRKQIYAFVFSKDDPKKRQFATVTGIDGYRAIAKRTGDYRPDEKEPDITFDPELIDQSNPLGIVKATVTVYQADRWGKWHPIVGVAHWDEFAPIESCDFKWEEIPGQFKPDGKPKYRKVETSSAKKLADNKPNWKNMPKVMISKCAEAQALRRGWPEEIGGILVQEEIDRALATEAVDQYREDERTRKIGGANSYPFIFAITEGIQLIPAGQVADRVLEYCNSLPTPQEVEFWQEQNRAGLQSFWAKEMSDALELKKGIEKIVASKGATQTQEEKHAQSK